MIEKKYLQNPKGTRDFSGITAKKRQKLIRFFEDCFENFGFELLITPNIEYKELVDSKSSDTYGEELKLVYSFQDMGGRNLVLKYDQTVPLARFVASNPALAMPYKRSVIGRNYRFENVQKGRYREFWQCDLDIVGSNNTKSDSFIISAVIYIYKKLGFKNAKMIYNNRKIVLEILAKFNINKEDSTKVIRALDKMDKKGIDFVTSLIVPIVGQDNSKKILEIFNNNLNNSDKLEFIKEYISTETYLETKSIFEDFVILGIEKDVEFNLFLTRGLDYYTSSVFEIIDSDSGMGSLGGGGRYDNMIEQFCGRRVPAVGFAFGFERIYDLLEERNLLDVPNNSNNIFIVSPNKSSKKTLELNKILLDNLLYSSYDFASRNLSKQIQYAFKNNFKYILICDLEELEDNHYKFKDLDKNVETVMSLEEIIKTLKN